MCGVVREYEYHEGAAGGLCAVMVWSSEASGNESGTVGSVRCNDGGGCEKVMVMNGKTGQDVIQRSRNLKKKKNYKRNKKCVAMVYTVG